MPIYSLKPENFSLQKNVLTVKIQSPILIFFKMPSCHWCKAFEPKFSEIAASETDIKFAVCDLGINKKIVQLSRASSTPINAVPALLFYNNGMPVAKYSGSSFDTGSVRNFLHKALASSSSEQNELSSLRVSSHRTEQMEDIPTGGFIAIPHNTPWVER